MNRKYFTALAEYNIWANRTVIGWLEQVNDEKWNKEIASSFSSIRQTTLHIASAEKIWIDFWKNNQHPVYLSAEFKGSKSDLLKIWSEASVGVRGFLKRFPEADYEKQIVFRDPRGGEVRMPFWQTFYHIINHSTYHRGQLVTLLRQVGSTHFSSIDLATFFIRQPHAAAIALSRKEIQ